MKCGCQTMVIQIQVQGQESDTKHKEKISFTVKDGKAMLGNQIKVTKVVTLDQSQCSSKCNSRSLVLTH